MRLETRRIRPVSVLAAFLIAAGTVHAETRPLTVAQVCDPQIGFTDLKDDICSIEQAVKQINLLNPDFTVICGDLVNGPNAVSFSDFSKIKEGFTMPCYCVPGNHDVGLEATTNSLAFYRGTFGKDYYSVRSNGYRFIFLNTPLYVTPLAGETAGETAWFKDELEKARQAENPAYIVGHHPLFYMSADEPDYWQSIPPAQRAQLLGLIRGTAVRGMLSGHTHSLVENRYEKMLFLSGEALSMNTNGHPIGFRIWQFDNKGNAAHTFVPLFKRRLITPKPAYNPPPARGPIATCLENLRLLDAAKELIGIEKCMTTGDTVRVEDIDERIKGGIAALKCPAGGAYTPNPLGEDPVCSAAGHQLPYFYQFEEFKDRAGRQKELRKQLNVARKQE